MPVPNAAMPADAAAAAAPAAAAPAAPAPAAPEAAAPQQVAAAAPAAAPSKYAVQLSARKSQTEALAAFADIQQKHPTLLANYRPMVSKDTLGTQGTLYKLRIGPIDGKTAADKLCGELKGQGTDCFVVAQ
jgi:cell division septation protein DedD